MRGDDITKVVADLRSLLKTNAATSTGKTQSVTNVATTDLTAPVLLRCIEHFGSEKACADFFDVGRTSVRHIVRKDAGAVVRAMHQPASTLETFVFERLHKAYVERIPVPLKLLKRVCEEGGFNVSRSTLHNDAETLHV